ncbi:hypothetical protein ACIBSV_47135 [Embleya sp. NPDC050154]|uniref:hypothetical protein n=1 Tax=Embleya sp. NPDC050154 TaxID=3363988 RepID=UPI0037B7B42D
MTPAQWLALHGDAATDVREFGDHQVVRGWSAEEYAEFEHVAEYAAWLAKRTETATTDTTTGETTR